MKILMLLLFAPVLLFSQNKRFVYEYAFVPNVNKKDSLVKELMFLDVENKTSKFYSAEKFRSDSAAKKSVEDQLKSGSKSFSIHKTYKGDINYMIKKDLSKNALTFEDKIGEDYFLVTDPRKMNWKIRPEKKKIGEWECQLATSDFGGRQWDAWFSSGIPIQDGPYKFYGLPGMIVKIEDGEKMHNFNLAAIQSLPETIDTKIDLKINAASYGLDSKAIPVSIEKYDKLLKAFKSDPAASFRQLVLTNTNMTFSKNGVPQSSAEVIRDRENFYKKKLAGNNNPIEKTFLD